MVVEFEEALRIVRAEAAKCSRPQTERIALLDAVGRVLADAVTADRDQPGFDRSTRDGFAVQSDGSAQRKVLGMVRAGEVWAGAPVGAGEAVQIMTGAPLPAGADAVVMVEHVTVRDGVLAVAEGRQLFAGENVVPRGSEARAGHAVLAAGTRIGAAEIALAAACGCVSLPVFARPSVAIVATGDELVEVEKTPGPQQIRNSNSYALAALVALGGGAPERLAIAPDTREEIRERIERSEQADLLVLSGGVSMGEFDLVEEVMAEFGAKFLFTGVKMQPGRPVVFGTMRGKPFFGLPRWALATLTEDVGAKAGLTRLLPARMDGVQVRLVGWQGSGDLAANARANCYVELLPGRGYGVGEVVRVLLR